jgi:release factor glutamine methyltransferase
MLLTEFLKNGIAVLESLYPTAEARTIVLMLCEAKIGTKNYTHIVEPNFEITSDQLPKLQSDMERLVKGEPIQYVVGKTEFCGLTFNVNSSVLIPRPETELLCREAIKIGSRIQRMRVAYGKAAVPVRILDLCTGSGNIAWTLALSIPGAKVVAVDISEEALQVASTQPFEELLEEKGAIAPEFIKADILDTDQEFNHGQFDLILSNPPYILNSEKPVLRQNVLDYEPELALFVPDSDPLKFFKAIAKWSDKFLAEEGKGLTEINEVLGQATLELFKTSGYGSSEIIKDFYDKNRFILFFK